MPGGVTFELGCDPFVLERCVIDVEENREQASTAPTFQRCRVTPSLIAHRPSLIAQQSLLINGRPKG